MSTNFIASSELARVKFVVLDENDNNIDACAEVVNKELFRNNAPFQGGVYDSRMGTTDNSYLCQTCSLNKNNCPGHYGKINTPYPMLSPIFKKEVLKWLKVICFSCGNHIVNIKKKNIDKSQLLNEAVKLSRTSTQKHIKCSFCDELHPIVEKDPKDHLKINIKINDIVRRLYNNEIEEIFSKIKNETVILLGKDLDSHPRKFVLRILRVPPVTIRPDIKKIKGGRSNNNDLTTILKNMISLIEKLPAVLTDELIKKHIIQLDNIEMHYYNLIRDVPAGNINKLQTNTGSNLVSISSRFAKKVGRIRKNILGKRTTYMARSVISADNIKPSEVGVPLSIARNIQIPEVVQYYNRERLMINFMNKDKQYPGCLKVVKKNGSEYYVGAIGDNFVLEDGDTIFRDLMDGDVIAMNRAPSLLYSSISGHIVKVMEKGDTLRLSPNVADSFYGGDFDGDAMMAIFPHSIQARTECWYLSGIPRWCMSLKDGSPSIGVYHDGLIGIFEYTKDGVNVNKYNSMRLLSTNDNVYTTFMLDKDIYSSHQLVSKLLPPINYTKKSGFYKPEYSDFINYNLNDIKVEISRGELIKGRIDKKSIGQGVDGSIFHVLYNEYGSEIALNTIFNLQQMTNIYLMHKGCTLTYDDITISKDALKKVHDQTEAILMESKQITDNLHKGRIIPPLGLNVKEFFEQLQLSILNLGDEFLRPVFEDIKPEENNLYKLIESGSKGKMTNLLQISSAIGQASIGGDRISKLFDYERTCPYFPRFDESPQNRGFVTESYTSGVDMVSFIFQAMEARYSIINKALSTSITGEQNRKSIKNLESLLIDNTRKVTCSKNIIQFIYGGDGVDTRNNEIVKFSTITISDKEFDDRFHTNLDDLDPIYKNDNIKKILDDEFQVLSNDRDLYRNIFLNIEKQNTKNKMLDDTKKLPINVNRIIEDVCYNYREIIESNTIKLSPIVILDKINKLCEDISYGHYNEIQKNKRMEIPEYIQKSFTLILISIRNYLNLKNIIKRNIPYNVLDIIINRIIFTFNKSLVDYGTPIGIITAQSISEPMTQYVLDSHHRTGASGTKTDFLVRMKEILGAKSTIKMKTPSMVIHINEKYKNNAYKVQEIANHIEMMSFKIFIDAYQIFFESYKEILHPDYLNEMKMLNDFTRHSPILKVPSDLIKWCIRIELNKEKLIEKNMKLETICFKLFELYPNLYIVNTAENADKIILRIYMRLSHFKKSQTIILETIENFINDELLNSIIRGMDNINSTNTTTKIARSRVNDLGAIEKYNESVIITDGTNLKEIFSNEFIDPYNTQSDSIIEIQQILGIEAAANAIVIQLSSMMPSACAQYYRVYADVMSSSGVVTSIDRQGIQAREKTNSLLIMANSHPLQTLEDVAINSTTARCDDTLSPALMVGAMPKQASNYNKIILNENFIQNNMMDLSSQLTNL